jgi:hypothetical protein
VLNDLRTQLLGGDANADDVELNDLLEDGVVEA